jgi:hypothetical protein
MCNCNTNCGCNTTTIPCECKVKLNSDCIDNITEDLTCSNILKGQTLSEVLVQLDTYICQRFNSVDEFIKLINVGAGSQIYKGDTLLGKKQLRTLVDSGLINIVQGTDTITISVDEVAMNTFIEASQKTYSAVSIGVGAQVYKNNTIVGDNTQLNFRKIKSSNSTVIITEGTDDIDITVDASVIPDGSETKIISGTNVVVAGNGTVATPYTIDSTNTTYSAGTNLSLVGTTFNNTAPDRTVVLTQGGATSITGTYPNFTISSVNTTYDGSETKVTAGTNISVTGNGTIATPYVVNSNYTADGSETKVTAGANTTVTGTGTVANPYIITNTAASPFLRKATYNIGDVTSSDVSITISFPDLGTSNYMVTGSLVSHSANFNDDNDVIWSIRAKTATSFNLLLKEQAGNTQNISFDYAILAF